MTYKVVATATFAREYDQVVRYHVESLGAPRAAATFMSELAKASDRLAAFPELNAISRKSALTKLDLREQLVGNYVAVYRVDHAAQAVYLLHLFHQSQDFEHLL